VGLRINELRHLDLADIKWDLGRFGKIHVRHGKGARGWRTSGTYGAVD
jgi:integrase/recombinase XerD